MAEAETPSEDIPDDHDVSRCWFDTAMGLDPASQFPFPFRNKYYEPESLYWRKYLAAIDDVHREGCLIQSLRNSREDGRGVPPSWYEIGRAHV